jgi:hypothetical protein
MTWFLLKVLHYAAFALAAPFGIGFVAFGWVAGWAHDKACDIEDLAKDAT